MLEKPHGLPPVKSRKQGPSGAGAVAGVWSLCASVAASAASCPGHIIPKDGPLGFQKARTFLPKRFGTKNTQFRKNVVSLFLCVFLFSFFFFPVGQVTGFYLEVAVTAALGLRKPG